MQTKRIKLNPVEATSYWWVLTIKKKLKEISVEQNNNEEKNFLMALYDFTDIEWRSLYLKLNEFINRKVMALSYEGENEYYHQDTSKGFHNDINEILCLVSQNNIPDISLNLSGIESSSIYTNKYGADRIYNLSGIVQLDSIYDSNYILSGDENELEMTNLIMYFMDLGLYKKSFEVLKEVFCDYYSQLYNDMDKKIIEDNFIRIFNHLKDQDLIPNLTDVKVKKLT